MFDRSKYYSQTEIVNKFKITVKGVKQLILEHQIEVVSKEVDLGEYSVKTVYIYKDFIDNLQLEMK